MTARHEIAHADAQRQARGAAAKAKGEGRQRLRDEFAMAALTGLVTMAYDSYGCHMEVEARVKLAFQHADAMMAERGK